MDPVLVAAAKFEIDPLMNALQARGHTPEPLLIGVGALNAAKAARAVGERCRGRHTLFVGTCGAFGAAPAGQPDVYLVRGSEVLWLPTCERLGLSYTVKGTAPMIPLPGPPAFCRELPARRVICSPGISLVSKLPEGIAPEGAVENLELYAVAGEIAAQAASFAVILAVTNMVGPDSHAAWRQNFVAAAGVTAEFIGGRMAL
jgi:hypothetical protein